MKFEVPGQVVDFPQLADGDVFFCTIDQTPTYAIKATGVVRGQGLQGAFLFTRGMDGLAPPLFLDAQRLVNRTVLHLPGAVIRGPSSPSLWQPGVASPQQTGQLMFGNGTEMLLRGFIDGIGVADLDVERGVFVAASDNWSGRLWTDNWSVVLGAGSVNEVVVVERSAPRSSAAA